MRPLVVTVLAGALLVAVAGWSRPPGMSAVVPAASGPAYTLMQMNLCLSGLAECYDPAVVQEAAARIRAVRPDAVTFNEACQGDVDHIARQVGYHVRFSRVVYRGTWLRCVRPRGRGVFGDAVLTRAAVVSTDSEEFKTEEGIERRRWMCVTTGVGISVCAAHLNTRASAELAGNDAQCVELAAVLARRATGGTVIFGGDMNRRRSCAPSGFSTLTDSSARQDPGLQHVYGSGALRSPSARVVPASHTDHDVLVVRVRDEFRPG